MEESLTPTVKAFRRFAAGRKPEQPKDTPLGALLVATEQRERLRRILDTQEGLQDTQITGAAVVLRFEGHEGGYPVIVKEGSESGALAQFEEYTRLGRAFHICGLMFTVRSGSEMYPFAYLIERTPEGSAALTFAWDRQLSRAPQIRRID